MDHLCLLAAGSGSRFGDNKLLSLLDGRPLWEYGYEVLKNAARQTGARVHVVTRYPEIYKTAGEDGIFCMDSEKGLSFSIRAACSACGHLTGKDRLVFLVADQPFVRVETVEKLLALPLAWELTQQDQPLAGCCWDGAVSGNPVVFSGALAPQLSMLTGDEGGKAVLRQYPGRVVRVPCSGRELADIDFKEDLTQALKSFSGNYPEEKRNQNGKETETMYAMKTLPDGHLSWSEVPMPDIAPDQVLVKVHAAGINRADLLQLAGAYPPPPGWPDRLGLEAAGEIVAVGEKADGKWKVGDAVCALLGSGGYAEYVAVPDALLLPVPQGITLQQAAGLPEVCGAAYLFLRTEGELKAGQTMLITAGASGLASVMIPMAKAYGARVITTAVSEEQAEKIRPLGADIVVNTAQTRLADVMKAELEAGRGVDIAVDCLGGETVGECLPYLSVDGKWIMIATLADDNTRVNLRSMYARRTRLIGTNLRSRTDAQKKQLLQEMAADLWPKVTSGEVRPVIDSVWPMQQAEQALGKMRSGKTAGKLILTICNE